MNIHFKVIGLTRLGIKPKSTAPEADALITRPSELLNKNAAKLDNKNTVKLDASAIRKVNFKIRPRVTGLK